MAMLTVGIGDVLAVRSSGLAGWLIRFGSHLRGHSDLDNHVVVVHHVDSAGVVWGIEGRPGGVGWADLTAYLTNPATRSNALQPRTVEQRQAIAATVEQMLTTEYDWTGIAADAVEDLHLKQLFAARWGNGVPGHVVCSSLAAYAHEHLGLARPNVGSERLCQPADWTEFDDRQAWNVRR